MRTFLLTFLVVSLFNLANTAGLPPMDMTLDDFLARFGDDAERVVDLMHPSLSNPRNEAAHTRSRRFGSDNTPPMQSPDERLAWLEQRLPPPPAWVGLSSFGHQSLRQGPRRTEDMASASTSMPRTARPNRVTNVEPIVRPNFFNFQDDPRLNEILDQIFAEIGSILDGERRASIWPIDQLEVAREIWRNRLPGSMDNSGLASHLVSIWNLVSEFKRWRLATGDLYITFHSRSPLSQEAPFLHPLSRLPRGESVIRVWTFSDDGRAAKQVRMYRFDQHTWDRFNTRNLPTEDIQLFRRRTSNHWSPITFDHVNEG